MAGKYEFKGDGYSCTVIFTNDPDPQKVNDGFSKLIKSAIRKGVDVDAIEREQRLLQSESE